MTYVRRVHTSSNKRWREKVTKGGEHHLKFVKSGSEDCGGMNTLHLLFQSKSQFLFCD